MSSDSGTPIHSSDATTDGDIDLALLERVWLGEASDVEVAHLEAWFVAHPEQRTWYEQFHAGIRELHRQQLPTTRRDHQRESILQAVALSQDAAESHASHALKVRPRMQPLQRHAKQRASQHSRFAGAGILGFTLAALGIFAVTLRSHRADTQPRAVRTYVTRRAQQAAVTLPDGSQVLLAPETRLAFHTEANGARIVQLSGAATLTVQHDARRSFVVQSGDAMVQVLGTQFTVQHYAADRMVQVSVASGRVSMAPIRGQHPMRLILDAGVTGSVVDSIATAARADTMHSYAAWTSGELMFRETPLPDVLATLTRWYGYQFQIADSSLAAYSLTAVLNAQSLADALKTIKPILNVDVTFAGRTITLHDRRIHGEHAPNRRDVESRLTTRHMEVGR